MDNINFYDVRMCPGDSAFLIDTGKTAILYDTGFGFTGYGIANKIKEILKSRPLDYIFLTHSHYDHALASAYILKVFPKAKVVAGTYAAYIFTRAGAISVMRELDKKVALKYGVTDYEFLGEELKVDICVNHGDVINAGELSFKVLNLPGHTNCSIGFYCEEKQLFLACETLGVFNGRDRVIPSVLVGYNSAISSVAEVEKLKIKNILAPHLGILNEEQTRFYIDHMKKELIEGADFIKSELAKNTDEKVINELYRKRYSDDFTKDAYPEDAAVLNTSIMIKLIKKEFNL